jgi:hypothetical protein
MVDLGTLPGGSRSTGAHDVNDSGRVASSISKSGPTISGDTSKAVLVNTNPGYGAEAGQPGSGTVVAQVCP